jgi:hypothetical protein
MIPTTMFCTVNLVPEVRLLPRKDAGESLRLRCVAVAAYLACQIRQRRDTIAEQHK